jgi:hypothetical protein
MGHFILFYFIFFGFHVFMFSRCGQRRHTNGQFGTVIGGILREWPIFLFFFVYSFFWLLLHHQKVSIMGKRVAGGQEPFVACQHGFLSSK